MSNILFTNKKIMFTMLCSEKEVLRESDLTQ